MTCHRRLPAPSAQLPLPPRRALLDGPDPRIFSCAAAGDVAGLRQLFEEVGSLERAFFLTNSHWQWRLHASAEVCRNQAAPHGYKLPATSAARHHIVRAQTHSFTNLSCSAQHPAACHPATAQCRFPTMTRMCSMVMAWHRCTWRRGAATWARSPSCCSASRSWTCRTMR